MSGLTRRCCGRLRSLAALSLLFAVERLYISGTEVIIPIVGSFNLDLRSPTWLKAASDEYPLSLGQTSACEKLRCLPRACFGRVAGGLAEPRPSRRDALATGRDGTAS